VASTAAELRRERFAREYLIDLNGTRAAVAAGYSPATAAVTASRLLKDAKVRALIGEAQADLMAEADIDAAWVLAALRDNYERAMTAVPVYDREGNPTGEYTYQGAVANRSLELIGKHIGMFVERHEVTGKDGGPIQHEDVTVARDRLRHRLAAWLPETG